MSAKSSTNSFSGCTKLALAAVFVCLLSTTTAVAAVREGEAPPPIGLSDTNGAPVDLQSLKGKVVLVDFWASWCGPCREEMPVLESLHEKYAEDGLVIVGVNIDRNPKKMRNFLKGSPVSFRIVSDRRLEVAGRYEPAAMPSSYFIDKQGKVRHVHEGFRKEDASQIESRLKALLVE
jgi:thiol-disulfide isomerase/thioredoxin